MINLELEIDEVLTKINIPTTWEEITVGQLESISQINMEGLNTLEQVVKIITTLTKADEDLIYMIPVEDFNLISEKLEFLKSEVKNTPADFVEVNGEQYWLKKDFDKLTMGESISIEALIEQSGGKLETALSKLLCIFLRKKKDNGKLETFKNSFIEREQMFKDIKVSDVYNLFVNFSNGRIG